VLEFFNALIGVEFIPASRIYVAANALNIKNAFYRNENVRLEANVIDMIVPAGMFAERGYKDLFGKVNLPSWAKALEKLSKSRLQNTYLRKVIACFSMTAIHPYLES
jgi:hypothetical protein